MRGKFIVIEGSDGCGKGTQIELLKDRLGDRDDFVFTQEPTNGEIGKLIRRALSGELKYSIETMALLFAADRHEHCKKIKSRLDNGINVISDRYIDSNYAYQGEAIGHTFISMANSGVLEPDLTIFLDVDVDEAWRRLTLRGSKVEIYENLDKLKRVRAAYKNIYLSQDPSKYVIVPSASPRSVHIAVLKAIVDATGIQ